MDTKKLRQKILDLAIRGKLVPQDPTDEPASVLLERIRAEKERLIAEGKIKRPRKTTQTADTHHYQQNVPEGWCISTIGDLFTLQAGKSISSNEINSNRNSGASYPCFGGNGLRGYVSNLNRQGDYPIIGRQGALCGNINLAQGDFYATEHAVTVERYCNVDLMWTFHALTSLNLNQYATATAQPGLSVNVINDVSIYVPPLQEQYRISRRIKTCFDLIDQIEQGKTDLQTAIKQAKSKILDLAIHGKLVPQDPNDEPASELLRRINPKAKITCDNEHSEKLPFEIPKGWVWCQVSDVFELNPKTDISDSTPSGFIPMASVEDGFGFSHTFETRQWGTIKRGYSHFQNGDIGIAKISPCFENRKSTIFYDLPNGVGAGTTELTILRGYSVHNKFYLYFFQSDWYILEGTKEFKGVVGQQRVNREIFTTLLIPLPPFPEQQRIVAKIEELFSILDNIQAALKV